MWWAGRLVKHEAERCCDEEVIAELAMKPARYARALLDVLDLKHILKPVPVLPGVKPVEITSNRLERIMLLRQGCRKRTPWWCWLAMLLTAALTLPGAAFVAQAKEKNKTKRQTKNEQKEKSITPVERHYKVGDVLQRIQADYKLPDEAAARQALEVFLKAAAFNQANQTGWNVRTPTIAPAFDAQTGLSLADKDATVAVVCDAPKAVKWDFANVDSDLTKYVANHMSLKKMKVINTERIRDWLDKNPNWKSPDEIGAAFGARYVVHIDVNDFTLYEKGSSDLYRGRSDLNVSVWKMDGKTGEKIFTKDLKSVYPLAVPRSTYDTKYTTFKREYFEALSKDIGRLFYEHQFIDGQLVDEHDNGEGYSIEGNTLTVNDTPPVQREIAKQLKHLRKYGFREVMVEAVLLTANPDVAFSAVSHWQTLLSAAAKNEQPGHGQSVASNLAETTGPQDRVEMTVEKLIPLRMTILNEAERQKLLETCRADRRTNIMFCPKVRLFNGRAATIQDTVQRPFVLGRSKEGKPALRLVTEGLTIKVRPVLGEKDQIHLESELTFSEIRGVSSVTLPGKSNSENPAKVQVPEIATTRVVRSISVPDGGSVLVGGLKPVDASTDPDEQLFVMLRVVSVSPETNARRNQPPAQAVSDVEVRYAKKAAELADLEYQSALKANRHLQGTVATLEVERLRLAAEMAHLQVEQAEFDFAKRRSGSLFLGTGLNRDAQALDRMKLGEKNFETDKIEPPTKEEVLKELPKSALENIDPKSIEIKIEKVADTTGESRSYPMVGPARLRTVRFKCTVSTTEEIRKASPVPETRHQAYVLYIDRNHLIIAAKPASAESKTSTIEARFWESLQTKHQFTDEAQGWSITVADVRGKTLIKPTVKYTFPAEKPR